VPCERRRNQRAKERFHSVQFGSLRVPRVREVTWNLWESCVTYGKAKGISWLRSGGIHVCHEYENHELFRWEGKRLLLIHLLVRTPYTPREEKS
jgi:hypothetical protein